MSIHTLDMHPGRPGLLLASLMWVVFLTNSRTESGYEHYLCSTTSFCRVRVHHVSEHFRSPRGGRVVRRQVPAGRDPIADFV
jgi:hypothetical protein